MAFGSLRRSKYEGLKKERDELKEHVKALTGEVETLRMEVADLKKERKESRRRISQLQKEADKLLAQNGRTLKLCWTPYQRKRNLPEDHPKTYPSHEETKKDKEKGSTLILDRSKSSFFNTLNLSCARVQQFTQMLWLGGTQC